MVVQQSLGLAERLRALGPERDVEVQVCSAACCCVSESVYHRNTP